MANLSRKRKNTKIKKPANEVPLNWIDKLEDLVLWNVVTQCAGTITHSPEKVCFIHLN